MKDTTESIKETFLCALTVEHSEEESRATLRARVIAALAHSTASEAMVEATGCPVHWELVDSGIYAITENGIPSFHETRRRRAEIALTAYMRLAGEDALEDIFVDLLTDLRHWCENRSLSFEAGVERSLSHFNVETYKE